MLKTSFATACQDRTILCLTKLPVNSGMIQKDKTPNTTLNNFSLGARFSYTCATPGLHSIDLKPLFPFIDQKQDVKFHILFRSQ
jgi:hypothetical protein